MAMTDADVASSIDQARAAGDDLLVRAWTALATVGDEDTRAVIYSAAQRRAYDTDPYGGRRRVGWQPTWRPDVFTAEIEQMAAAWVAAHRQEVPA